MFLPSPAFSSTIPLPLPTTIDTSSVIRSSFFPTGRYFILHLSGPTLLGYEPGGSLTFDIETPTVATSFPRRSKTLNLPPLTANSIILLPRPPFHPSPTTRNETRHHYGEYSWGLPSLAILVYLIGPSEKFAGYISGISCPAVSIPRLPYRKQILLLPCPSPLF